MLVKIVKCKSSGFWYNMSIGEVFDVDNETDNGNLLLRSDLLHRINDKNYPVRCIKIEDVVEFNRHEKLTKIINRIKYENS